MNMNNREKFLVIVLAAIIILLGGFKLLIEPQIENFKITKADLTTAQSQKKQANDNVIKSEIVDAQNKQLTSDISDYAKSLFPELKNDEINVFFQQIADNVGVSFAYITMSDKTVTQINGFSPINNEISYPAKDEAYSVKDIENGGNGKATNNQSSSETTSSNPSTKNSKNTVEMMAVSMQFEGTYEQSLALIDQIKNSGKTVRINSLNMSRTEGKIVITISTECFGIAKITDDAELLDAFSSPAGKGNPFN